MMMGININGINEKKKKEMLEWLIPPRYTPIGVILSHDNDLIGYKVFDILDNNTKILSISDIVNMGLNNEHIPGVIFEMKNDKDEPYILRGISITFDNTYYDYMLMNKVNIEGRIIEKGLDTIIGMYSDNFVVINSNAEIVEIISKEDLMNNHRKRYIGLNKITSIGSKPRVSIIALRDIDINTLKDGRSNKRDDKE